MFLTTSIFFFPPHPIGKELLYDHEVFEQTQLWDASGIDWSICVCADAWPQPELPPPTPGRHEAEHPSWNYNDDAHRLSGTMNFLTQSSLLQGLPN